jgi:hypothetical protein
MSGEGGNGKGAGRDAGGTKGAAKGGWIWAPIEIVGHPVHSNDGQTLHNAGGHTSIEALGERGRGTFVPFQSACEPRKTFPSFDLGRHIATFKLAPASENESRENVQKRNASTKQVGPVRKDR